ncbi:MAG: hypothetical protein WBC93_09715 [Sulfitobacter sp.]
MITPTLRRQPGGAALMQVIGFFMDIILHIGAHRTGTTTFQDYLRRHRAFFFDAKIAILTPPHTRRSLFVGLSPASEAKTRPHAIERAQGRIRLQMALLRAQGFKTLIISEENMIGSVRANLRAMALYPDIGARMSRIAAAFDGQISRILISPRAQDSYWSSALSYGVARGHHVLDDDARNRLVHTPRGWREVITDVASAVPATDIKVLPFETFAGHPDAVLRLGAGLDAPADGSCSRLNPTPDLPALRAVLADRGERLDSLPKGMGRWQPFNEIDTAILRENYADDMMWLTAGADSLATLTQGTAPVRAGKTLPLGVQRQGHQNDRQERHLARPRSG